MRTTFTEEQLQVLQANFEIDSNPDGQDLERIAQVTGIKMNDSRANKFQRSENFMINLEQILQV